MTPPHEQTVVDEQVVGLPYEVLAEVRRFGERQARMAGRLEGVERLVEGETSVPSSRRCPRTTTPACAPSSALPHDQRLVLTCPRMLNLHHILPVLRVPTGRTLLVDANPPWMRT